MAATEPATPSHQEITTMDHNNPPTVDRDDDPDPRDEVVTPVGPKKAEVTQRATDQVNGPLMGGQH
jgi:hypothetical protein